MTTSAYSHRPAASARRWRVVAAVAVGLACLWSPYTLVLGVVVLLVAVGGVFAPQLGAVGARSTYRRSSLLQEPMTCGVSDTKMWVQGASFRFESLWSNLGVWREREGWLVLSPHGMSPVFLDVGQLREAGVYERVRALGEAHGQEFGAARPRRR